MKRNAMNLITAFCCTAAVLHLVSGQDIIRPNFNARSYAGIEGGSITGNLEIPGLRFEDASPDSTITYEIQAIDGLATYGTDYRFRGESQPRFTEVTFSRGRDESTNFSINLREDMLAEGKETFSLSSSFKGATGDFSAFTYASSSTNPEGTIEDKDTGGILMMCILNSDVIYRSSDNFFVFLFRGYLCHGSHSC
jgi:hypothetical protein